MEKIVILDMDGVISDFTAGMCRAMGIDYDPDNYPFPKGLWDYVGHLERVKGISWKDVEAICSNPRFWIDLPLMPDAKNLYRLLTEGCGFEVYFLTTPTGDPIANFDGKRAWLEWHGFAMPHDKRMILMEPGESKGKYAVYSSVLMDDQDKNIQDFIKSGGHGVLVPRPWNNRHFDFVSYARANRAAVGNLLEIEL